MNKHNLLIKINKKNCSSFLFACYNIRNKTFIKKGKIMGVYIKNTETYTIKYNKNNLKDLKGILNDILHYNDHPK